MKKNIDRLVFFGLALFIILECTARLPFSHVITFFIQEAPFKSDDAIQKFKQLVATPGKIASKIANSIVTFAHQGIFATYGGYLVVSDYNGQITFPRMQQKEQLTLIITEKIEPVFMLGNTIHHWTLPNIPASLYSIERKEDPQLKLFYWNVQETKEPDNKIIPITSIVIFAKPKNIIVPQGITITHDNPQFVLPTIYATKNINDLAPALSVLKIRAFFGPLSITNKKENDTYYSTQINSTQ
jgi:hypothetical protein